MICPRCAFDGIDRLATSPVPGVWEVLSCGRCLYTWRTTEPPRRTTREAYPPQFRMTQADIDSASEVPPVPPLRPASG
ncbi:non-oxidative hydroxyarylic acid decarboxylases subunit D [Dactylosporangium sp. CA-139114]|uniref:non-oxidative hydroxyarylic acid decarboxylases subunit D n=1 Tax=Dactylosporangium sp. CA-139114 TaxID=3239931 RepID=UPI003D9667BC